MTTVAAQFVAGVYVQVSTQLGVLVSPVNQNSWLVHFSGETKPRPVQNRIIKRISMCPAQAEEGDPLTLLINTNGLKAGMDLYFVRIIDSTYILVKDMKKNEEFALDHFYLGTRTAK